MKLATRSLVPSTLLGLLVVACAGVATRSDVRSALPPAPSVLSPGPIDYYETMVAVPTAPRWVDEPAAEVRVLGEARHEEGRTYVSRSFELENVGAVPLAYHAYGAPVDGRAMLTPNALLVSDDGAEVPFSGGWCGTGLEEHVLAPGERLTFDAGMQVDPDGEAFAYRVTVALTAPDGERLVAKSPVLR